MSGKIDPIVRIICVAACLIIAVGLVLFVGQRPADEIYSPDFTPKTVHYRFQIRNTTNQPVSDAHFFVHAPLKLTGAQHCVRIEASHPYELVTDSVESYCIDSRSLMNELENKAMPKAYRRKYLNHRRAFLV